MSIEQKIEANTAALLALTAAINHLAAKPGAKTAFEAENKPALSAQQARDTLDGAATRERTAAAGAAKETTVTKLKSAEKPAPEATGTAPESSAGGESSSLSREELIARIGTHLKAGRTAPAKEAVAAAGVANVLALNEEQLTKLLETLDFFAKQAA